MERDDAAGQKPLELNADPNDRFMQKTYSLGAEQNFPWDKALAMADAIEDEEINRKLRLRK